MNKNLIKDYFSIIKPGIIFGNAITVLAGFFLALQGDIDFALLAATLAGVSLVMAAGCVFNNVIDRDIDAVMERTRNRALARGSISPLHALLYGGVLAILGLSLLYVYTNFLTMSVALVGLFVYVIVYTLLLKRHSGYGTFAGSIAGAIPPVLGYLAVSNTVDAGAVILFIILALWQIPHSFAIALYRIEDYTRAGIQVLPVKKGTHATKIHTLVYVALFIVASLMLPVFGYVGQMYFAVMLVVGLVWFWFAAVGLSTKNDKQWARKMFMFSILVIVMFSVVIIIS